MLVADINRYESWAKQVYREGCLGKTWTCVAGPNLKLNSGGWWWLVLIQVGSVQDFEIHMECGLGSSLEFVYPRLTGLPDWYINYFIDRVYVQLYTFSSIVIPLEIQTKPRIDYVKARWTWPNPSCTMVGNLQSDVWVWAWDGNNLGWDNTSSDPPDLCPYSLYFFGTL